MLGLNSNYMRFSERGGPLFRGFGIVEDVHLRYEVSKVVWATQSKNQAAHIETYLHPNRATHFDTDIRPNRAAHMEPVWSPITWQAQCGFAQLEQSD